MTAAGHRVAKLALEKLLQKAERAWARQAEMTCSLVFSDASFPDYLKLPQRADKDVVHAELRNAMRAGAITAEWDRRAGIDGQILRVQLVDAELVAAMLNRLPIWRTFELAENRLQPWRENLSVQAVLAQWRAGKQVKGLSADRVGDFVDGCKVIAACRQLPPSEDMPVRRLSAALFADSKRIEAIAQALDALTIESLDVPGRDIEDILSGLGLVKHPMPVLIAGNGIVELIDGTAIQIPAPYIGLAPQSIKNISLSDDDAYVLTVENLTIFNELALGKAGSLHGVVLYTAGMPSPALLRVYRLIMAALKQGSRRFHWGDIDLGGFRIAAAFARTADSSPLNLWSMDPAEFPSVTARKSLSNDEKREIVRIGEQWGWGQLAQRIYDDGRAIEQEAMHLTLPVTNPAV
ncbi:MAG: DUF2220 family protein [Gallionella sp.]|nr:DUF2220 family protein [Gallionella sp.]